MGRLTQIQDETITSVDARVPDPGCAKTRQTGAQTPPGPAQTGAKAAAESGPEPAVIRVVGVQTPSEAVTTQVVAPIGGDNAVSPVPAALLAAHDPVAHDPALAVIEKYKREFDLQLWEFDHLE